MGLRQTDYHSLDIKQSVVPVTKAAGLTADVVKGTGIDLSDCQAATLEVNYGDLATLNTTVDMVWQESDTDVDGNYTDVAAADLLNGLFTQVVPAGGASGIVKNAYLGAKRYIRAKFTVTTAASTGAATYAANVIKGHLRYSV